MHESGGKRSPAQVFQVVLLLLMISQWLGTFHLLSCSQQHRNNDRNILKMLKNWLICGAALVYSCF